MNIAYYIIYVILSLVLRRTLVYVNAHFIRIRDKIRCLRLMREEQVSK